MALAGAWDGTIATAVAAHGGRAICTAPAEEANALPSGASAFAAAAARAVVFTRQARVVRSASAGAIQLTPAPMIAVFRAARRGDTLLLRAVQHSQVLLGGHRIGAAVTAIAGTANTFAAVAVSMVTAVIFATVELTSLAVEGVIAGAVALTAGAPAAAVVLALDHITGLTRVALLATTLAHGAHAVTTAVVDAPGVFVFVRQLAGRTCCGGGKSEEGGRWAQILFDAIHQSWGILRFDCP